VVVVSGSEEQRPQGSQVTVDLDALIQALLDGHGVRGCAQRISEMTGLRRRDVYQRALEIQSA
jgi:hypothetical protein